MKRLAMVWLGLLWASPVWADFQWQPAEDPGALGWDAAALDRAEALAATLQTESVMIVDRSGRVVRQWGPVDRAFDVFSVRKSLVSVLVGIQAARGSIDLQATLADLDIDDRQGLSEAERQARVLDLLMARSGVYHPAAWETPGMIENRPRRGAYPPGQHWYYNNWDFNALNSVFLKATGHAVHEALLTDLAIPLGFQDHGPRHGFMVYETVSDHPSALLWISGRDLARVGLMLLNQGRWEGQQQVPKDWIDESTRPHSDLGLLGGYGYSWWAARDGLHFPFVQIPPGSYSARGTGEQILLVMPAIDTVIVHRARVCGPGSGFMHVTDFGRLLAKILEARGIESSWPPIPPPPVPPSDR